MAQKDAVERPCRWVGSAWMFSNASPWAWFQLFYVKNEAYNPELCLIPPHFPKSRYHIVELLLVSLSYQ